MEKMEKTEKTAEKKKVEGKRERKIVVPGDVVASGQNYLPGEGVRREGNDLLASRYGILESDERVVRVSPISGTYIPRRGNVIIGMIKDITFNGWIMDINSPYSSFLSIVECRGFISKRDDLSLIFNYGDMVVAKVVGVKAKGVDLTTKDKGLHKLDDGLIVKINSHKVPRVIGKQGSMVSIIKESTGCDIVVGQNGVVWISGQNLDSELLAKEAINMIAENALESGLTDKIKHFLEERKKEKK